MEEGEEEEGWKKHAERMIRQERRGERAGGRIKGGRIKGGRELRDGEN